MWENSRGQLDGLLEQFSVACLMGEPSEEFVVELGEITFLMGRDIAVHPVLKCRRPTNTPSVKFSWGTRCTSRYEVREQVPSTHGDPDAVLFARMIFQ